MTIQTILRRFSIAILLCFPGGLLFACDVCGCANSGSYFGLMPQSHKSIVGVRYNHMYFETHPDSKILRTAETFNIAELYARFFPIKRVQVMAFVPYRFDRQSTSAITKTNSGLGDISVLANYNLFNTFMDGSGSSKVTHTLLVGGGIKLPTGKFRFDSNDYLQVANASFQPGTGSVDFVVNAFYTLKYGDWGLSSNVSGKINTTNPEEYRFGNQLYGTVDVFRTLPVGKYSLTPSVGVYGEKAGHGTDRGKELEITGGTILNGSVSLNFFAEKWMLGVTMQKPVYQRSNSGDVFARDRFQVQLGWLF